MPSVITFPYLVQLHFSPSTLPSYPLLIASCCCVMWGFLEAGILFLGGGFHKSVMFGLALLNLGLTLVGILALVVWIRSKDPPQNCEEEQVDDTIARFKPTSSLPFLLSVVPVATATIALYASFPDLDSATPLLSSCLILVSIPYLTVPVYYARRLRIWLMWDWLYAFSICFLLMLSMMQGGLILLDFLPSLGILHWNMLILGSDRVDIKLLWCKLYFADMIAAVAFITMAFEVHHSWGWILLPWSVCFLIALEFSSAFKAIILGGSTTTGSISQGKAGMCSPNFSVSSESPPDTGWILRDDSQP